MKTILLLSFISASALVIKFNQSVSKNVQLKNESLQTISVVEQSLHEANGTTVNNSTQKDTIIKKRYTTHSTDIFYLILYGEYAAK